MITSEIDRGGAGPAGPAHAGDVSFRSILFGDGRPVDEDVHERPDVFRDLNLDQIVAVLTAEREPYDLLPFLQAPLRTVDEVEYARMSSPSWRTTSWSGACSGSPRGCG